MKRDALEAPNDRERHFFLALHGELRAADATRVETVSYRLPEDLPRSTPAS